jgi:hypothetical protein
MTNEEARIVAAVLTAVAGGETLAEAVDPLQKLCPHHWFYVEDDGQTLGLHKTPRQRALEKTQREATKEV